MDDMNQTIYQLKVMFIVDPTYYGVPNSEFPGEVNEALRHVR